MSTSESVDQDEEKTPEPEVLEVADVEPVMPELKQAVVIGGLAHHADADHPTGLISATAWCAGTGHTRYGRDRPFLNWVAQQPGAANRSAAEWADSYNAFLALPVK